MMQSTPNYLWELSDILGQGATASVYKARNKKTGEEVAVKVFNNHSYLRPYEVQMREFEMLGKLKHVNIVKLFAVEETGTTKQKVLIMEYCSSGSLLSVLEEPENAYGLSESEFLIVVDCVVAGMNHLRQNGIVHRDIKPGNIMRLIGEDGRSIYKLTDFGAARELEDDEKFMSIYGTEEYLHPDMYERAVLKKPHQKVYGVTVDLWSIGVTIYHAACGSLPFIPYGGPRRNKETMHKMTTEKPAKAIAGIQRKENGAIEWFYELPITCRLSVGLKTPLQSILPSILEADQEKCWGFDQFFAETNNILEKMAVHVFSLMQASMHKIYVHAYNSVGIFLEAVCKQTGVDPQVQRYFYEGHPYHMDPNLQIQLVSRTTEQCPFLMMSSECDDPKGVLYKDPALDYPKFQPSIDVIFDCVSAKNAVSVVYQTIRVSQSLVKCQEFILRGTYWLMYSSVPKGNRDSYEQEQEEESLRKRQSIGSILSNSSHISEMEVILGNMQLEIAEGQDQILVDTSINRMEHCLQKILLIYKQFKKRRIEPLLGYNEKQIHKLDKLNFALWAKKVLTIFQEVTDKYRSALAAHTKRMGSILNTEQHLMLVNGHLGTCIRELRSYEEFVNNAINRLTQKIQIASVQTTQNTPYLSHVPADFSLRLLQLREQMKSVSSELEQNNTFIERLGSALPHDV
ncbi:inhibitor of nuclear factor kappa-B kinase subunit epsilon isoform X2 [Bombina bombina]|uniref:inhibitor of nuclear factor kappa-B kinase subunit epsilon isoform X2 n=1 Tax=Bombina bombina TaxID=8345 RepID=UPI00235A4E16|nr:inhibitor of nuclear factor kappa-B kinase subunit epsilon isoform X2 [Bombina bombina]